MTTIVQSTVGALATQAVETYLQRVESYEKAVIKDRDTEDLHQMRVNLRRLRTVMQVFAPGIFLPKAGRESRVADIARKLGELRDVDVISATLQEQYLPDLPDTERKSLKVIFDYLAKRRKKLRKQTKSTLKSERYQSLKASLHQWIAHPNCNDIANLTIGTTLPDLTLPLVSRLWLHPGWLVNVKQAKDKLEPNTGLNVVEIDRVVAESSDTLHSLRKQIKRVRYQLKLVSKFYSDRLKGDLAKLVELQESLGNLQDSLVMEDFLQQVLPNWQTQLPTLKALLRHNRHRAWQEWQKLQCYYLDPQSRATLRQRLMQPGTENSSSTQDGLTQPATGQKQDKLTGRKSDTVKKTKSTSRKPSAKKDIPADTETPAKTDEASKSQ